MGAATPSATYDERRGRLETYFDATASKAWAQLTSDAPVSRIRETVRAGRDRMRGVLLSWLPADLTAVSLLDAGCGTGALAAEAAGRGARVTAIDVAGSLVAIARDRTPADAARRIDFRVGDMLDPALGRFDHVVAIAEILTALARLAPRVKRSVVFTFAPRTPALSVMHAAGKLFPKADRAPVIEPVTEARLRAGVAAHPGLRDWGVRRTERVASGFYTSQAMELVRR